MAVLRQSTSVTLLLLMVVSAAESGGFFMQLFADSGMPIACPSGNPVYIHPILADLQQCEQQLGNYNESTCPGGTVCERFPILVPEFQDFCCWVNKTESGSKRTDDKGTTNEENLSFSRRGTPDREVVEAIIERPKIDENSRESEVKEEDVNEEKGEVAKQKKSGRKSGRRTTTPSPVDEDSSEGDLEQATRRPKRPRSRKGSSTSTTERTTTTTRPVNHGLPQCSDPNDSVFLDLGNRLRDCYYQRCERGYRCEFNKRIRRFICCGQDLGLVPPPGLPMVPVPKPLNPRALRPRPQQPFGQLSDGAVDDHGRRQGPRNCCDMNDCSRERQWENDCRRRGSRCPNQEYKEYSSNGCSLEKFPGNVREPIGHFGPIDRERPSNGCNMNSNACGQSPMNMNEVTMRRPLEGLPEPPEPLQLQKIPMVQNVRQEVPMFRVLPIRGSGGGGESAVVLGGSDVSERGHVFSNIQHPEEMRRPISTSFVASSPFDSHRQAEVAPSLVRPRKLTMRRLTPVQRVGSSSRERLSMGGQPPASLLGTKTSPSVKKRARGGNPISGASSCAGGTEYKLDGLVPSCDSSNSSFCPASHPNCSFSTAYRHRVCCSSIVHHASTGTAP
ncbi:hypothetical protein Q1695_001873 [Nippostrongylus brasiliensis]|nr:hypothetical protein Q1695_001873 [Nippostrongylus brasiliensis]